MRVKPHLLLCHLFFFCLRTHVMSGKLIETTFQTGPQDDLAAVDVYEGGGGVENTYDDQRANAIDVMDALGGSANGASSQESPFNAGSQQTTSSESSYSFTEAFKRMAGSESSISGFLNNLSTSAKSLFSLFPSSSSINVGSAPIKNLASINDVKSMVGIINTLSKNNFNKTVTDTGATKELITKTVTTASNNGINGSYQALVKNDTLDRKVLIDSAIDSIDQTVKIGNIATALDVSQTNLMSDVISKNPGTIQTVFNTPKLENIKIQDQNDIYKVLSSSFTNANVNWNKTIIKDKTITDLKDMNVSDQMKKLITYDVNNLELTIYVGSDRTENVLIDYQLDDISNMAVIETMFGVDVSAETIAEQTALWNSIGHQEAIEQYQTSKDMLIGSMFGGMTVQNAIDKHFSYLNIKTNTLVYRPEAIIT